MSGFYVSSFKEEIELKNVFDDRCTKGRIEDGLFVIKRNTLNKFLDDKPFIRTDSLIVLIEGVVLNKTKLLVKYGFKSFEELCVGLYNIKGIGFIDELRGPFSGAICDIKNKKWYFFSSHIGDQFFFYFICQSGFVIGSQVNYVVDTCKKNSINLSVNESAIYQMLTYGYMADDSTYAKEIKRMPGGSILSISYGGNNLEWTIKKYCDIKKDYSRFKNASEDELIEAVDTTFRNAVKMEYDKDVEYKYDHYADLSGGLDSRMAMWVAHEISDKHIQLGTWSKSYYLDEKIARDIAWYWKDEILVRQLEDLRYMYDINKEIELTGGLLLYIGPTGAFRFLESLNYLKFGLRHTGQIGDVVLGSFAKKSKESKLVYGTGLYSERYLSKIKCFSSDIINKYEDMEMYLLNTRGFLCASNHMADRNLFETTSPFFDIDFLQLCVDIPTAIRANHNLYKKWILKKYPKAARFIWESTGCKINANVIEQKSVNLKKRITRSVYKKSNPNHMNPLDYFLMHDKKTSSWMNKWFKYNMDLVYGLVDEETRKDIVGMYKDGNTIEKCMAMTVVGSLKLYF